MRRTACPIVSEGDIGVNIRSFARALRAESVSPKTIETYLELAGQLADLLERFKPSHCQQPVQRASALLQLARRRGRPTIIGLISKIPFTQTLHRILSYRG